MESANILTAWAFFIVIPCFALLGWLGWILCRYQGDCRNCPHRPGNARKDCADEKENHSLRNPVD